MDVLTPRSLDEALRLKAEQPEARPVAGGTDVLVELNFDRSRPPALLNLNEVAELRGWGRENGTLVLGAGLTYTEAMQPPLATVDVTDSLDQVFADLSGPNAAVVVAAAGRPAAILTRSDLLEYLAHQRSQVNGT